MSGQGPVVVVAGGTGGHLFPAAALSHALAARGFTVHLVTDERAAQYGGDFPACAVHKLAAATPSGGSLVRRVRAIVTIIRSTRAARRLFKQIRPRAVIGFGGYPTVPPVLAASRLGVPVILHEGNAVIGRANRFLADRVEAIAKGFEVLGGIPDKMAAKTHLTGNPVRPMVIDAARKKSEDHRQDGRNHEPDQRRQKGRIPRDGAGHHAADNKGYKGVIGRIRRNEDARCGQSPETSCSRRADGIAPAPSCGKFR